MTTQPPQGSFQIRKTCRICLNGGLTEILKFPDMPSAGAFLRPDEIDSELCFPLTVDFCPACAEVQLRETVSADLLFRDYRFLASTTKSLTDHFAAYAGEMVRRFGLGAKSLVIEFGSNDGVLLLPFMKAGVRAVGVEPARNIAAVAVSRGCTVINDFFNRETATKISTDHGKADLICANNVFAHIDDMHEVMRGVTEALGPRGVFVFEVHYLVDLVESWQYDFIYHEHMMYHSIHPLRHLMRLFGMEIFDVDRHDIHCGSIRVFACRKDQFASFAGSNRVDQLLQLERDRGVDRADALKAFGAGVVSRSQQLTELVRSLRAQGKRVVGYGASGRASVHMNLSRLGPDLLEYVVDASPERAGRVIPGMHNPIVLPERFHADNADYAVVFAYNYLAEISGKERKFLERGGRFIVPAPDPKIVESV